jgi:hypothetical protein
MNPRMPVQIPRELANRVIEFATNTTNIQTRFKRNGYDENRRRFCNLNSFPELTLTQDVKQFAKIAYEQIGVSEFVEEHMFGNFVGVNSHGGNVHQHTDPRHDNGYYHIRFNFLLQKPIIGGNPIINGIEYQLTEGQSWINYASEWMHGSTPVDGNRERIVLSLGAYIHPDVVAKITERINNTVETVYDYSRVIQPQEDFYDITVMNNLKIKKRWAPHTYPAQLLKFDNRICMLPKDSTTEFPKVLNINYNQLENTWKRAWNLGYNNIVNLVDIITPHFPEVGKPEQNFSGHVPDTARYGYPNVWGIMSTFGNQEPEVIFTNIFHELMHWKLLALGFGTGPNTFFPTTKDFILNDESELCWSIVNSYADTAQPAVGNKPTDRPVSASLHAYVSFLGVAYSYVQFLKVNPNSHVAKAKAKQWGSRFDKSFNELLKVGKFTDNGQQLMKGLGKWTSDFYKEYGKLI